MKISVFGLGYVGAVSAACLARHGHQVIGVDPVETKVGLINEGRTPIIEKDIDVLIERTVKEGRLCATTRAEKAVADSEASIICVVRRAGATAG